MKRLIWLSFGLAAGLASSAAFGFDEQKRGTGTPGAALDAPQAAAPAAKTGPEIRIPGFGKIGTLPKLDFGLELLYGANDPKPVPEQPRGTPDSSDVTVRGSIKYKFGN